MTNRRNLRVALARLALAPANDWKVLAQRMQQHVVSASRNDAALVVFPEMVNLALVDRGSDGDQIVDPSQVGEAMRERLSFESVVRIWDYMQDLAGEFTIWISAGTYWFEDDEGVPRNAGVLLGPNEERIVQYKIHPTAHELDIGTEGGSDLTVTHINGVGIATTICYDIEFPEVGRLAHSRGAEILLCPSLTYNRLGANRVSTCAAARAIEFQCFVLVCPYVGRLSLPSANPIRAVGGTSVRSPIDKIFKLEDGIIGSLDGATATDLVVDLDVDLLTKSRASSDVPTLSHRRETLYKGWT